MSISKRIFTTDKTQLIFNGEKLQIFIPDSYFKDGFANVVGSNINTIGIFNFKTMAHSEFNVGELHTLILPSNITFSYSNKVKGTYKLSKDLKEENYYIYELYTGDIFIEHLEIIENTNDTKTFINLLHSGKLPTNTSYRKIINLYYNSLDLNNVSLGVPSVILEIIIAELARSEKDDNKAFRFIANENNLTSYKFLSLRTLPEVNSTFTAISFENMNQSIITSINHTNRDDKEMESPLEKTIKY